MCDPATAMVALSIASAGAGLYGEAQAAKAQESYNKDLARNATIANNQRNAQINQRQLQERDAATQKMMNNNIEAKKAEGAARVAAGSAGVGGISVDSLLGEIGMNQGRYNNSVAENLRSSNVGLDWERVNAYNDMSSTFNSMKTPAKPNYLGAALKIGTAGMDYANKTGMTFGGSSGSNSRLPDSPSFDSYYNMERL